MDPAFVNGQSSREEDLLTHKPRSDPTADPPSNADAHHPFSFPALNIDGSVEYPPAQITQQLATKMQRNAISESVSSLDDSSYDLVDDISELSNDDRETASIASTDIHDDHDSDTGLCTPPEDVDITAGVSSKKSLARSTKGHQLMSDNAKAARGLTIQACQEVAPKHQHGTTQTDADETSADEQVDDLETPRQSTITAKYATQSPFAVDQNTAPFSSNQINEVPLPSKSRNFNLPSSLLKIVVSLLCVIIVGRTYMVYPSTASLDERRIHLSTALADFTGSEDLAKAFNISHLLPEPVKRETGLFGLASPDLPEIRYQGAAPNYLVVSLPRILSFPKPISLNVTKGSKEIEANLTRLITGVYGITINPNEAHGAVSVSMFCDKLKLPVSITHNFGIRMLQRQTYEHAGAELGKTLIKDLAAARQAAMLIRNALQLDIEAGVEKARQVTSVVIDNGKNGMTVATQTAVRVMDEVEVTRRRLMEVLDKRIDDSLSLAIARATKILQSSVKTIKEKLIKDPIKLSQERASTVVQKLFARVKSKKDIRVKQKGRAKGKPVRRV